jgi:hypothetical protein
MIMHKIDRLIHRYPLLLAGALAFALTITVALFVQVAQGDHDPEHSPDSDFMATIPIASQPTVEASMAEKQQIEDRWTQEKQAALLGPQGSKDSANTGPGNSFNPTVRTGIFDVGPVPSGWSSMYRTTNRWKNIVNGQETIVHAGSVTDDRTYGTFNTPEQGLVIVMWWDNPSDPEPGIAEYRTPNRTGMLTITSYSGTCLTLLSTGNTTYQFDVATRQWSCQVNNQPPPP